MRLITTGAACAVAVASCTNPTCPADASAIGTLSVSFWSVDAGDSCVLEYAADGGGPTDAGLVTASGSTTMTFCAQSDGGAQLYVLFSDGLATPVSLDAGYFSTDSSSSNVTGTNCGCAVDIEETLAGYLRIADGGGWAVQADGGVPGVSKFTGIIDEFFTAHESGSSCACNVPCSIHYSVRTL